VRQACRRATAWLADAKETPLEQLNANEIDTPRQQAEELCDPTCSERFSLSKSACTSSTENLDGKSSDHWASALTSSSTRFRSSSNSVKRRLTAHFDGSGTSLLGSVGVVVAGDMSFACEL
jgi:hypothetical protein